MCRNSSIFTNVLPAFQIVAVVVKPLLEHYEANAQSLLPATPQGDSRRRQQQAEALQLPPEALVYLLNCLHSLHGALARLAFTGTQIAAVAERIEAVLSALTQTQAGHILARAGLRRLYEAVSERKDGEQDSEPLAQRVGPGCSQADIVDALVRW